MRNLSVCSAGILATLIFGCGPGKELPELTPPTQEPTKRSQEPEVTVPKASETEAKAVVERAIAALTKKKPETLKGKLSRAVGTGNMKFPSDSGSGLMSVEATRDVQAHWPDKVKVSYKFLTHYTGTQTHILRKPFIWLGRDGTETPVPNRAMAEDAILTDTLAQQWLPLLFPLNDSKTIVFDRRQVASIPPTETIRVSISERPVYQLTFDSVSGHLTRVEYNHTDLLGRSFKSWTFSEHQPFGEYVLPARLESGRVSERSKVRETVEEWTIKSWDFPAQFSETAFDPPK